MWKNLDHTAHTTHGVPCMNERARRGLRRRAGPDTANPERTLKLTRCTLLPPDLDKGRDRRERAKEEKEAHLQLQQRISAAKVLRRRHRSCLREMAGSPKNGRSSEQPALARGHSMSPSLTGIGSMSGTGAGSSFDSRNFMLTSSVANASADASATDGPFATLGVQPQMIPTISQHSGAVFRCPCCCFIGHTIRVM